MRKAARHCFGHQRWRRRTQGAPKTRSTARQRPLIQIRPGGGPRGAAGLLAASETQPGPGEKGGLEPPCASAAAAATAATSSYVRSFVLLKRALGLGRGGSSVSSHSFPAHKQELTQSREGGMRKKRHLMKAFTRARILFFFFNFFPLTFLSNSQFAVNIRLPIT